MGMVIELKWDKPKGCGRATSKLTLSPDRPSKADATGPCTWASASEGPGKDTNGTSRAFCMGVGNKADCKDAKTDCATAVAMLVTSAVDRVELMVLSTAPEVVELSYEVVTGGTGASLWCRV